MSGIETTYLPWRISGSYLEACNCEAICPCRTIGGIKGGRSTEGICQGSLSWQIDEGTAGKADLAGLRTVLALRYDDDEPGSPWDFFLYIDERADSRQSEALEGIFLGRLGGTPEVQFPWVWKESRLLGVRRVPIQIDHTPGRGWFRAGGQCGGCGYAAASVRGMSCTSWGPAAARGPLPLAHPRKPVRVPPDWPIASLEQAFKPPRTGWRSSCPARAM